MQKLLDLAAELGLKNTALTTGQGICFDRRAVLKCRWGCNFGHQGSSKCGTRGLTFEQCRDTVRAYKRVLVAGHPEARPLTLGLLELERAAFLSGNRFAFVLRTCNYCKQCSLEQSKPCAFPDQVRPCDQAFGIDVFRTVEELGLPIGVLQDKDAIPNRYGFLLID